MQTDAWASDISPVCPLTCPWLMCLSHHVSSPGGGSGLRSLWAVISREARSMPSNSAIRSRPKMSPCLSRTCRRKPQAMKTGWSWKRGHCLNRGSRDAQLCMRNRGNIFLGRRTWFLQVTRRKVQHPAVTVVKLMAALYCWGGRLITGAGGMPTALTVPATPASLPFPHSYPRHLTRFYLAHSSPLQQNSSLPWPTHTPAYPR